jgi:hypothetical protein
MPGPFVLSPQILLMSGCLRFDWCRCWIFGDGRVEHCVELGDITDQGVALLGDDEDGRGLGEADALAEGVVGANLSSEEAVGVDDEGHRVTVGLKVFLREGVEIFLGGDGDLVREDGAAIVFGGLGRDLVLHVPGDDGGVKTPDVHLEREVVADEGNLVLLDGRVDDGEGVSAGRTLEVFELEDGDAGPGGGTKHRSIFEAIRTLGTGGEAGGKGKEQGGDEDDAVHCYKTHKIIFLYFI